MKVVKLFLLIGFVALCLLAYSNGTETVNHKVTSVLKFDKQIATLERAPRGAYIVNCPNGGIGCGDTPGLYCQSGMKACPPPMPPPIYERYSCPDYPGSYACVLGSGTPYPPCTTAKSCAEAPAEPTMHAQECIYGSIAYGCYPSWTSGNPPCFSLINCDTIPPLNIPK